MKKVIWIVNEYNFPDEFKSRQTILCSLLNSMGYDTYIISGSAKNKGGNVLTEGKFKFVKTNEAKGYIIRTGSYSNNYERVLTSIQFQARLWHLRNVLPKPDVIISDFAGLFGYVFLKWKKKYGIKLIYDILDLWPEGFVDMGYLNKNSPVTKILYRMEHKTYREADSIFFSFQGGRDYIVDKGWSRDTGGDVDTDSIGYLNNGLDVACFDEQKEKNIYEDRDLDSSKFKVIYLGSISSFNGLDALLEAAEVLQNRNCRNIDILVYGCGNNETRIREKAADLKLENIKFKGRVDKKYAPNILSRGDLNLFVFKKTHLLKYGVSPNKLFMYFASSKPVLSLIRPGFDLVEENNAGVSVETAEEAADWILRFSKMNRNEYDLYCKNARQVAEKYDYRILVNSLVQKIEN